MPFDISVREHERSELRSAIAVAARAFWDDPLFNFFMPDLLKQHRSLPAVFHSAIGDAAEHGQVSVAVHEGTCVGVAAWLPPGVHAPTGGRRALTQMRRAGPAIARSPERRRALQLLNEMPKHHPPDEHWYLAVLATDPLYQGRGVGAALLDPVLTRCDDGGFPTYLETQKEANLAYYGRFGFAVVGTIDIAGCPPVWRMTRPPR